VTGSSRLTVNRAPLGLGAGGLKIVGDDREREMLEAFPEVDPQFVPYGSRVLLQVRSAQRVTRGGIELPPDMQRTQQDNMQVAKVIAVGPLAFKNRSTQEPWPEGAWARPGEFVRIAKYGGDRWRMPVSGGPKGAEAEFVLFNDLDLLGRFTGDPLSVRAFV
jgi:co-chaperonin GroES (HSP10)